MNLKKTRERAHLNLQEKKIFPREKYKLTIYDGEHNPPHFHVVSVEEDYEVKLLISTGELYQVERYGKRGRTDKFEDVVAKAKEWIEAEPALPAAKALKTNRRVLAFLWRAMNCED